MSGVIKKEIVGQDRVITSSSNSIITVLYFVDGGGRKTFDSCWVLFTEQKLFTVLFTES